MNDHREVGGPADGLVCRPIGRVVGMRHLRYSPTVLMAAASGADAGRSSRAGRRQERGRGRGLASTVRRVSAALKTYTDPVSRHAALRVLPSDGPKMARRTRSVQAAKGSTVTLWNGTD